MTRPVGQIEVWEPGGGAALYTITDFVNVYYREILTSGVGNFTFQVYSHKDFSGTYTYPNIDVGDTVKIWLDWDTVAGNPNFIGKVTKRTGPIKTSTGWVREISGLSQGEIMLRMAKSNKFYTGTNASVIVAEWAGDMSLGVGDITADARQPDIEVRTKTYFDLMRHISDYWLDGANKIKKDFWVDLDGDLVWGVRPLRTVGVESFTTADFLADPQVIRSVESVKNAITVLGSADRPYPVDYDGWTETSSGDWTLDQGDSLADDAVIFQVGANSLSGFTGVAGSIIEFKRADLGTQTMRTLQDLHFWRAHSVQGFISGPYLRILAPDEANYFHYTFSTGAGDNAWREIILALGPDNVYDAASNPTGLWLTQGSPNWWDMQGFEVYTQFSAVNMKVWIDGLYIYPIRWSGTAEDAGGGSSQALYGVRQHEVTDDKLHTDTECARRAETMLFMLKDLPIQIKIAVLGNDNVLVGDRLTMTIASESISSDPYDVIVVENALNLDNWITQATMVNSVNTRQPLSSRPLDYIARANRQLRELAMEEKGI